MTKKTWIVVSSIVLVLLIATLIFSFVPTGKVVEQKTIKIGVIEAMSGDLAKYGQGNFNAAQLAVDEINEKGGIDGKQLELILEDSPCKAETAITAYNKLVGIDQVNMILGPLCSSELMAIAPINEKTVIMSTSATSPDITNAGEYIFRAVTSDLLRSKVFARYIFQEKNVKEISVIYENDVAGNDFFKSFKEEFESLGGKVIISEQYAKGSTDMRTQLTAIKTKNPSSILMLSYPGETGLILKQMKELDIRAQLFEGFEVMKDPQIKEIAGDAIEGVIFIQPEVPSSQKTMNFITAYKEKYNQDPVFFAAEAYDVINLYAKVLEEGTSSESIKNNLYKIKDYEGASGKITFDENGDVIKPFEIGQIQNLEPVTIKIV